MSSKLLIDSAFTIVTRFAGKAANLLVFVVLARKLSIAEFGLYGYVATMGLLVATALDFGTRHSIGYYYPKLAGNESQVKFQAKLWILTFSTVGAIGFGWYIWNFVPGFSAWTVVIPSCLVIPGMLGIRIEQGVLLGQGRIKEYNSSEAWPRTLLLILTAATFILDVITIQVALWTLAVAYLVSAVRVACYNWVTPAMLSAGWAEFLSVSRKIILRGVRYFPGILLMVAAKRVNVVVVQDVLGPEGMGAYYGVMRLGEVVTEVALAVGVALFAHSVRSADQSKAIVETAKISRVSMAFLAVVSVIALAAADLIVPLMLGEDYAPYVNLYRVAVLCTLVGALWNLLTPVLYAAANPMLTFWLFLPGFMLNLALTLILVPRYGVLGAAYSLLISQLVISASYLAVFRRKFNVGPLSLLVLRPSEVREMFALGLGKIRRKLASRKRGGR